MKYMLVAMVCIVLVCLALSAGCSSNGGIVNPMEGVKLDMNIPITKAPNSFIDPKAPTPVAVTGAPTTSVNITVTPTSTYVFRYE